MSGENLNDLFDVVPEGEPVVEETLPVETPEVTDPEVTHETPEVKPDETPEVPAEADPTPEADPTIDAPKSADEVSQLRILLREQNRRIRELQSKVEKSTGELKEKG